MADEHSPNKNLKAAKASNDSLPPEIKEQADKPITPMVSMIFLFQFFDRELMKMLFVQYAAENISDATKP